MTSIKQPGACNSAIYANAIFPVGRPVVVCIPQPGNLAAKPAVSLRYYRSAMSFVPPRHGVDWPGGQKSSNALRAIFDRRRGTRPVDLNLGRYLTGWSSRVLSTLRQLRQEARGVFTVSLRPGPFDVVFHARNKAWRLAHDVQKNSASGA
jgi:hypothetical protein